MADDTSRLSTDQSRDVPGGRDSARAPGRGPRDGREAGGFRIRLSDNEMQAARALQEAFGLRSTVAVLGFSLRTLAQQLEAGQLDELVAQQRAQGGSRSPGPRRDGERRDGERRGGRDEGRGGGRAEGVRQAARVNPFARPSKPVTPSSAPPEDEGGSGSAADSGEEALERAADPAMDPGAEAMAEAVAEPGAGSEAPTETVSPAEDAVTAAVVSAEAPAAEAAGEGATATSADEA